MRTIHERLRVGDVVNYQGVKYYVRELYRGKICIQRTDSNVETDREKDGGIWVNPLDDRLSEEMSTITEISQKRIAYCASCASLDTTKDGVKYCASCQKNEQTIASLKNLYQ